MASCFMRVTHRSLGQLVLLLLLLDEAEVTGDFAADLFQVLEFALKLRARLSLLVQLFFELGDVGLAAHCAQLRLSWLHL